MPIWQSSSHPETEHDALRCIIDDAGKLVFASPAVSWALGVAAPTLANRNAAEIMRAVEQGETPLHKLHSGFYEVALLRAARDPLVVQARLDRIAIPDGRAFTVLWLDPNEKLKRGGDMARTAQDFARFIIAQSAPKAEEAKPDIGHISKDDGELRHFLNIANDLLAVYRRDGSFVRVNPAFNRVLGYSDSELKLFPFIELIPSEDRDMLQPAIRKILQAPMDQEVRVDFESRARCRDGTLLHMQWNNKVAGDHVYIVGRDITSVKRHEAELLRREEQLTEAQKIGRMGHWYWELNRQSMEFSDQIYAIFGVEKGQFSPTLDNINTLILKRDLTRVHKSFQRTMLRKRDYEIQFRVRRPGGGIRFIHCEGRCKVNPRTGAVEALFGIMQDITERTVHERALREALAAAENAYASKTRFLANMSHELRTPLNAIIGFSEMIQRQLLGPVGNARYLDYIGNIRESGVHLLDLINDILDMSKIEIGKYELNVEEMNLGKLIRLALHMVEGRAEESQIRLLSNDIPDDLQVVADRRALMQVLLNLLSNAVKFTQAGGSVEVRCHKELGGVAIVVSDTGIGIPKDKIGVVVMPFEQVDNALERKHEGSGLGLAITKDLVELHGGALEIESELGVGTTVTVLLPDRKTKA